MRNLNDKWHNDLIFSFQLNNQPFSERLTLRPANIVMKGKCKLSIDKAKGKGVLLRLSIGFFFRKTTNDKINT